MSDEQTKPVEEALETGSRDDLKSKFANNETPTGNDFADLIDAAINQLDDGIAVNESRISFAKGIALTDPAALAGASYIEHDKLNIADKLVLGGTEFSETLKVYNTFSVHDNEADCDVAIGKTNAAGQVHALAVTGSSVFNGQFDVDGQLNAHGDAQLNGALDVTGDINVTGSVDATQTLTVGALGEFKDQVNIGELGSSANALLNIRNIASETRDLLRLEDSSEDTTPMVVKGNGRVGIHNDDPQNLLDISGNVRIGSSALMDGVDNSLSVETRLGIGIATPRAKLDVYSTGESELVRIGKNDKTVVKVTDNGADADIQLMARTLVGDTLTVNEAITAKSIDILGELTAGSATINGLSQTGTLVVGPETTTETGPVSAAAATFNLDVNVKGLTSLQHTHVYGKLDAKTQLSAHKANVRDKLAVGVTDEVIADAVLQVKAAGADSSALLVKDHENKDVIRVKQGLVDLGNDNTPVNLHVSGNSQVNNLTVSLVSELADASISKHLSIGELGHDITSDSAEHARFCLTSDTSIPKAIRIKHQDGTTVTNLMASKADKLGFHVSEPLVAFHVGAASQFDEQASFLSGLNVLNDQSGNTMFSVAEAGASFGHASAPVPVTVYGETDIFGHFNINALLNATEETLNLNQQVAGIPLKIVQTDSLDYIHASAGQLAINTPLGDKSLDVLGDAQISGQVRIEHMAEGDNALEVLGKAQVSHIFTVNGVTFLNDAVNVTGPLTVSHSGDEGINALNVTGHGAFSQSLAVADGVDITGELTVTGLGTFNNALVVSGTAEFSQTVNVTGKMTVDDELHIQGDDVSGLAMTVDKRANFRDNLLVSGDIGLSTIEPTARLHIQQIDPTKAAFKIDTVGDEDSGLIFKQGKLGVGVADPDAELVVAGTAKINQDLHVKRQAYLDNCLYVDQLATFSSNIKVHGLTELNGQTVIGDINYPDNDAARTAQLCLFQNSYASAFKIISENEAPVVFARGKLGIGTDNPQVELDVSGQVDIKGTLFVRDTVEIRGRVTQFQGADVWGDVILHSDLTVGDNTVLQDSLEVVGKTTLKNTLDVNRACHFLSTLDVVENVTFSANLDVGNHTTLKGNLTVANMGACVTLCPPTTLESSLTVNSSSVFQGKAQFDQSLALGLDKQQTQAKMHICADTEQPALIVDVSNPPLSELSNTTTTDKQRALIVTADGKLGLHCPTPTATLDVNGNVHVAQELTAKKVILEEGLAFQSSLEITDFSNDVSLGGEAASETVLPTQAAVKAYIDDVSRRFGYGGKVCAIYCQTEFNALFNCGHDTQIAENTTILLFPLVSESAISGKYMLKNTVVLGSGVSIIGFNEKTTCIIKDTRINDMPVGRFIIKGTHQNAVVEDIKLEGFTFDGDNYVHPTSGGAFELKYAKNCQLNCHIVNHKSAGNGGAIYGEMQNGQQTVSHIEALNIRYCSAENNAGGGAYGLALSHIKAKHCLAKFGGAVACCDESKVEAMDNTALVYGGGAYFCNNLFCDGFWQGNHAPEGKNIYANDCQSATETHVHYEYYWHALYLDAPIISHSDFWRSDNL
ncbi:hypothetical protein HQQ94_09605 [Shewanella sp. VB17]|uniref:hypothetical protein n=1 Tax=Shewanella sp. VB17 TaxID=2739432 RepID=UPI001566AF44|nr:hypothetical protein [Shewanella sp. VB17]NRD73496.1 hypothetical protein [Shewanella sp. VB17]